MSARGCLLVTCLAMIAGVAEVRAAPTVPGRAAGESELAPVPPSLVAAVKVEEKPLAVVPKATRFRTLDGAVTTLGEVLAGDLPTLLTFNYSSCPSLCSMQLNGLVKALAGSSYRVGRQVRVVTIGLAPDESPADAARQRERYLAKLRELGAEVESSGWVFLLAEHPDKDLSVRAVADAVGVGYQFIPTQREYAHPAVTVALSSQGAVTRYVHGVEPNPIELDETIRRAGLAEPSTSTGFVMACLHWDAAANSQRWGGTVLRIAALVFLALGALAVGVLVARNRRGPGVDPS